MTMPKEALPEVMSGRDPKVLMDIHDVSDVNDPDIDLSVVPGSPTSDTFGDKKI